MAAVRRPSQSLAASSARARREGSGFGHAQVAQIQRARILAAMFDVASERGAVNVSVADVVERSGVSRRTFYETFADREDCFLAAFEDAFVFASERVLPAYRSGDSWRKRIRAGLVAFLSFLDEEPVIGRLFVVESLTGCAKTLERREEILAGVASAVDEGRGESASARDIPELTADGVVGGVLSLVAARIVRDQPQRAHTQTSRGGGSLVGLSNQLMSMIVLPYLGPTAARRELEHPIEIPITSADRGDRRDTRLFEDPFKGAGMRLTYRTVRVLLAVGEHSGASNRVIGRTAGITDQGQISKLLGRLTRLGLVENTGLGPGQGAPNAWTLTGTGGRVVHRISASTKGTQ